MVTNAFGSKQAGIGSLAGASIGVVSSLLIGELADALDLSGFERGLFQSVGTSITAQLVTNAYGAATGLVVPGSVTGELYTLGYGFDAAGLLTNISGAIGGYLGSYLSGQLVLPSSAEGALGQSIGSSVGAALTQSQAALCNQRRKRNARDRAQDRIGRRLAPFVGTIREGNILITCNRSRMGCV